MADESPKTAPDGGADLSNSSIPADSLTARQHAAINALLAEKTLGEAAAKAQVAESTLRRWLASDEAFRSAYLGARRQIMEAIVGRLQQAAILAVDSLERNLSCGKAGVEVQAANAVLDHAMKGLQLSDLAERLKAIERAMTA